MGLAGFDPHDSTGIVMALMQALDSADDCPICGQPVVFAVQLAVKPDGSQAHFCTLELFKSKGDEHIAELLSEASEESRKRLDHMRQMVAEADASVEDEARIDQEVEAFQVPDSLEDLQ